MGIKQFGFKALHLAKTHAPEIMIVGSIVAGAAALYFTARGTMKLEEILDEHNEKIDDIKSELGDVESSENPEEVTVYKKELTKQYVTTAGKIALAYLPAAAFAGSSVALSISAHGIMRKRLATSIAALESVTASFEAYRQRVKDKYGEEAERDILTGKHQEKIAVEKTDKKGNTKLVDQVVDEYGNIVSPYARYFDKYNENFLNVSHGNEGCGRIYNQEYLEGVQTMMNCKLRVQGYLFLNDVYRSLGFEDSPEGQLVGWLDQPKDGGDGEVSFNIKHIVPDINNENEDKWLLDFNVDGIIVDKI